MSSELSPEQRSLRARMAAHVMHSRNDPTVTTAPGRAAFLARFEKQVDPDGVLPEAERERRAQHALRAHMSRLAFNSAKARSAKGGVVMGTRRSEGAPPKRGSTETFTTTASTTTTRGRDVHDT